MDYNKKNKHRGVVLAVNEFADLTSSEFKHSFTNPNPSIKLGEPVKIDPTKIKTLNITDMPDSLDWRDHNIVPPVEN